MEIRSLPQVVRVHAAQRPEAPALTYQGHTRSYLDLDRESSRIARALLDLGIRPHQRVAFLDKNTPEYFAVLLGAAKVNAVTVAVNWRLAPREMEFILNDAEAKALVIGEEFLDHLPKMELETVEKVVVVGESDEYEPYPEWVARFPDRDTGIEPDVDDTCYQLYTSGTTGLPKGVELTHRNLFTMMPAGSAEWQFDSTSVSLVGMPLFHIAGSGWGVLGLYNGAHNVLLRDVDPAEILRLIENHGVTNCFLVPAVLQFLLQIPQIETTDFSTLRMMSYGASPISEEVLTGSMKAMGCDFVQVYGLTETTGAVTVLAPEDHDPGGPKAHLLRSAGRPWGDVEVKIIDPETLEAKADGEVGEIVIRSVQNMKGYWKRAEATREAFLDGGWFRTGDAGYLRDGYVFIHDRVKDMIVSGGENIYPAEIENVLMSHPAVKDCAVIGIPSEKWGETVKALVVKADHSEPKERELIDYCRERLAHYKCPTSVEWIEAVPRNPSGKILKTELRKPYWDGRDRFVS